MCGTTELNTIPITGLPSTPDASERTYVVSPCELTPWTTAVPWAVSDTKLPKRVTSWVAAASARCQVRFCARLKNEPCMETAASARAKSLRAARTIRYKILAVIEDRGFFEHLGFWLLCSAFPALRLALRSHPATKFMKSGETGFIQKTREVLSYAAQYESSPSG